MFAGLLLPSGTVVAAFDGVHRLRSESTPGYGSWAQSRCAALQTLRTTAQAGTALVEQLVNRVGWGGSSGFENLPTGGVPAVLG